MLYLLLVRAKVEGRRDISVDVEVVLVVEETEQERS